MRPADLDGGQRVPVILMPPTDDDLAARLGPGPVWIKRLGRDSEYEFSVAVSLPDDYPDLWDEVVDAMVDDDDVAGLAAAVAGRDKDLDAFLALRDKGWVIQTESIAGSPEAKLPGDLCASRRLTAAKAMHEMGRFLDGEWEIYGKGRFSCFVEGAMHLDLVRLYRGDLVVVSLDLRDAWRAECDPGFAGSAGSVIPEVVCGSCLSAPGVVLSPGLGVLVCERCAEGIAPAALDAPVAGFAGGTLESLASRLELAANDPAIDLRSVDPRVLEEWLSDPDGQGAHAPAMRVYLSMSYDSESQSIEAATALNFTDARMIAPCQYYGTVDDRPEADEVVLKKDGGWQRMVAVDLVLEPQPVVRRPVRAAPSSTRVGVYGEELVPASFRRRDARGGDVSLGAAEPTPA